MSGPMSALAHRATAQPPLRRVRHEVRDGIAVMAFSLVSSVAVAFLFGLVLLVVGN